MLWFIAKKLVSIFLIIAGIFLVFFFPVMGEHQPEQFTISGVIMGFIFLGIGAYLLLT